MDKQALRKLIEAVENGRDIFPNDFPVGFRAVPRAIAAHYGSLDAAKALHETLLPGWMWLVMATDDVDGGQCSENCGGFANVWGGSCPNEGGVHFGALATNPARAWLLAILKAMEAENG